MTKPCPSVGISYMSGNWPVPANIDNTIPSTFYQFKSTNMLEINAAFIVDQKFWLRLNFIFNVKEGGYFNRNL